MDYGARATAYARAVDKGQIVACEYVRQAARRHLADLRSSKTKKFRWTFDSDKASRACRFIELLPHVKGAWAKHHERFVLSEWQIFVVGSIFGWVSKRRGRDPGGLRRFTEAYLEVPRKNGKSFLGAAIGLYMLVADGEVGAEVYSGATSENQAWEVFRPAREIANKTPALRRRFNLEVNAGNLFVVPTGSRFSPVTHDPGDGASPHCALIDEYHEHKDTRLYDTMITGMGARDQPLMLILTTAGATIGGPCYERRDSIIKILSGAAVNDRVFGIIYSIDPDVPWTSVEALKMANPNYGASVSEEFLLQRQHDAIQNPNRQNAFKTKHLNVWVGAMDIWLNMERWAAAPPRASLDNLLGRRCFIGLDLASKIDIASLVMLFPVDDEDGDTEDDVAPRREYHVFAKHFVPEDRIKSGDDDNALQYQEWADDGLIAMTPGSLVDFDYIMAEIRYCAELFSVDGIGYDPFQATHLATVLTGEGLPMIAVPQTYKSLTVGMVDVEAWVEDGRLAHGGDPVLTWMAGNTRARRNRQDAMMPGKELRRAKIDGIVALIIAAVINAANTRREIAVEKWFL